MPIAPRKPCAFPACPELTNKRYCPEHKKKVQQNYEKTRETAQARGYTHRWQKVRKRKLSKNPLCEIHSQRDEIVPAVLVHHIDKNPKNNKSENLQSLCNRCHEELHHREGDRWKK
jgi:5-methylcytosine-specific restriction protein A